MNANYKMFVGGNWVEADGGKRFDSDNPFTGRSWASIPHGTTADVDAAVAAAKSALTTGDWPAMSASQRGALLRKLGDLIVEEADRLAEIETRDNGKLLNETSLQIRYTAQFYYYYGGMADKIEGAVIPVEKPNIHNYTRLEPIGVVAVITPWNSPLLIAAGKIGAALAAGCTVVVKPSEFTSASTLALAELFERAGFPKGVLNVISGFGHEIGDYFVGHPDVGCVAFTGGTSTGQRINEVAAKTFKKTVLELGGKSPNIIFEDADLDNAILGAVSGIFAASGQSCVAGSRLLVQRSIHDQVVERLVDFAKSIKLGDPMAPDTHMGPIATRPQYERVLSYFDIARSDGAECVVGGTPLDGDGQFVQPTIYTGVKNDMRIAQEEIFGPLLSIIPFDDDDHALSIANDTLYGLASGVWTQNMQRAFRFSHALQAGQVWVNMYRAASYMTPLGGYKRSGLGSENGKDHVYDYLHKKAVWMNYGEDAPQPFVQKL
ncbi:aldehyde dehydrogenase family protein [Maritimibacter sp. DP07]|uniref:Aldehyde dehydrogenase family protein n=2 Tax=Maritimibacter harenae TaxID=2606218 RepID=A0A845LV35_9RHOB|nr:aldehyde dehydrogenase family protein [Maritimibacter harenae]